ncbi:alpha/beta fold hydrolase [Amycolatopsis sp. 195334CR]|uniref:alpha/beta fold hydrolase n=1 Tax=Amycolatopsis sp. 195334CR TaxID=2814588 RepID=UPI001A8FF2D1|nr:alpha/beta hydrolase [Amycolatopsis sp. 195334CR]MBN6040437.1 alpha/beta fold hydrolase [Amycolatopsis sp. 195334CR]
MPLVLLHGVMATSLSFQAHAAELGVHHPVYAVDSLGEPGRSVQTAPLPDPESVADWLDQVLAALGHERVHLAGVSRGGWLALNQAIRRPRRLSGVTAVDPGGLADLGLKQHLWLAAGLGLMLSPTVLRRRFAKTSFSAFLDDTVRRITLAQFSHRTKAFMFDTLTEDQWRSLRVPVDLVLGGRSVLYDAERQARRIAALSPSVRVEVVPDAAHGIELMDLVTDRALRASGSSPES